MDKPKEYFHLVTNEKLELGQKILFNKDTNNKLYDFFFKKSLEIMKEKTVLILLTLDQHLVDCY